MSENTFLKSDITDIPRFCSYCDYRHCCNVEKIIKYDECDDFILGKCFYCAIHQSDPECKETQELCTYGEWNWPEGCENFKPGLYYDEYLESVADNEYKFSNQDQTYDHEDLGGFVKTKVASRHLKRRGDTEKVKKKRFRDYNNTSGWYKYPYTVKNERPIKVICTKIYPATIKDVGHYERKKVQRYDPVNDKYYWEEELFYHKTGEENVPEKKVKYTKTIGYEPVTPYLCRWDKKSGWKKNIKRQSHKKVRKTKELYQGWSEHKLFD